MTDRKLLELAAKAAGVPWSQWDYKKLRELGHNVMPDDCWNPLTDDGDALRLAVKFEIDIDFGFPRNYVRCVFPLEPCNVPDNYESLTPDPYAATRRAIVRAAAEIGKAMK